MELRLLLGATLLLAAVDAISLSFLLLHHAISRYFRRYRHTRLQQLRRRVIEAAADPGQPLPRPEKPFDRIWLGEICAQFAFLSPRLTRYLEEEGYLDRLIRETRSPLWWRRVKACTLLGLSRSARALPPIAACLSDPFPAVRLKALESLGLLGTREAAETVAGALPAFPPAALPWLRAALLPLARAYPEVLRSCLQNPLPLSTAKAVLESLGLARDRQSLPLLLAHLRHPEAELRLSSARALGYLEEKQYWVHLLPALEDPRWEVRAQAARSLGRLGQAEAAPALASKLTDPAFWVRANAARALASLGEAGEAELLAALSLPDPFARDAARAALQQKSLRREAEDERF